MLLGDEREALVLEDRDDHREDVPRLLLRARVELLAEGHDVDALLTERGAHRRGGVGLTGWDLQFDFTDDFFSHLSSEFELELPSGDRG